jgi:hypothetical protein
VELSADWTVPFARDIVFAAYRDRIHQLIPYLPNIRGFEVRSRREQGTVTELVNVWRGGGDIPAAARAFVSDNMLSWTDYARWDKTAYTCEWRFEPHALADAVQCHGCNQFVASGRATRIEIRATLYIDASKIPGVPRWLAPRLGPMAEQLLSARIEPSMAQVNGALERFLSEAGAGTYIAAAN